MTSVHPNLLPPVLVSETGGRQSNRTDLNDQDSIVRVVSVFLFEYCAPEPCTKK